jgi:uncharacterized Tic20 family protein
MNDTNQAQQDNVQATQASSSEISKDARTWAMFCHLGGLAALIQIPFAGIIAPLVIWLLKKDEDPFINENGKEAVNFQITIAIMVAISFVLFLVFIGILTLIATAIYNLVFIIIAAIKTNEGQHYRYPFAFRFIK